MNAVVVRRCAHESARDVGRMHNRGMCVRKDVGDARNQSEGREVRVFMCVCEHACAYVLWLSQAKDLSSRAVRQQLDIV
jgi:hypothetical protein